MHWRFHAQTIRPLPSDERNYVCVKGYGCFVNWASINNRKDFGCLGRDDVVAPVLGWTGPRDTVPPPETAEFLKQALEPRVPVDLRVVADADHFSFMDVRPPNMPETLPNRAKFVATLAEQARSCANKPFTLPRRSSAPTCCLHKPTICRERSVAK